MGMHYEAVGGRPLERHGSSGLLHRSAGSVPVGDSGYYVVRPDGTYEPLSNTDRIAYEDVPIEAPAPLARTYTQEPVIYREGGGQGPLYTMADEPPPGYVFADSPQAPIYTTSQVKSQQASKATAPTLKDKIMGMMKKKPAAGTGATTTVYQGSPYAQGSPLGAGRYPTHTSATTVPPPKKPMDPKIMAAGGAAALLLIILAAYFMGGPGSSTYDWHTGVNYHLCKRNAQRQDCDRIGCHFDKKSKTCRVPRWQDTLKRHGRFDFNVLFLGEEDSGRYTCANGLTYAVGSSPASPFSHREHLIKPPKDNEGQPWVHYEAFNLGRTSTRLFVSPSVAMSEIPMADDQMELVLRMVAGAGTGTYNLGDKLWSQVDKNRIDRTVVVLDAKEIVAHGWVGSKVNEDVLADWRTAISAIRDVSSHALVIVNRNGASRSAWNLALSLKEELEESTGMAFFWDCGSRLDEVEVSKFVHKLHVDRAGLRKLTGYRRATAQGDRPQTAPAWAEGLNSLHSRVRKEAEPHILQYNDERYRE